MNKQLLPVEGCWIRHITDQSPFNSSGLYPASIRTFDKGRVLKIKMEGTKASALCLFKGNRRAWISVAELVSGFEVGEIVQEVPSSNIQTSLGAGAIQAQRLLAGSHQALVHFAQTGKLLWLPFERLRKIKSVRDRYIRQETGVENPAEHFRLRLLAHALESWNMITGALDRLDVDPLPHQIQLVHRILSSGNLNWLIADDVGLGKTIEVGLLLGALKRRNQARRVLIVVPAGLVLQWQNELKFKFDEIYEIYGRDFLINDPEHWKLHEKVIVSLDKAKNENHLQQFVNSGPWDVIVFDEAHKISRVPQGEKTERYILAEHLRKLTDGFLFLTATPHQGKTGKFAALLELVRPDLGRQLYSLDYNPEIVSEVILRNKKSEVTNASGEFIFNGHETHLVPVKPSEATKIFSKALDDYLKHGYGASEQLGGHQGRAIGFVMTIFRKLASSSIAAIERSLRKRLVRLQGESLAHEAEELDWDLYEGGDDQDNLDISLSSSSQQEFFAHETEMLMDLIQLVMVVREQDEKLALFINQVIRPLVEAEEKVLIFSEYRGTQEYIVEAIQAAFPEASAPCLINGSMGLDDKLENIRLFREERQFMISTEAGGEGLNLHHSCHVMVNYDLPWNPSRLVQRIGRLYRYGQEKRVVVFNLQTQDSFDAEMLSLLLGKVSDIARDMAPIGDDFHEGLHTEILGELLDQLDLEEILDNARNKDIKKTEGEIDAALKRAQEARALQEEILRHANGYDPLAMKSLLGVTAEHVSAFVRGMLSKLELTIIHETHSGRIITIRLPEELVGMFPEFDRRHNISLCFDRKLIRDRRDLFMMDFASSFFQMLIEEAKSHEFDGQYAPITTGSSGEIAAFKLKWQTAQGDLATEEFQVFSREAGGEWVSAGSWLSNWLTIAQTSHLSNKSDVPADRILTIKSAQEFSEKRLGQKTTAFRLPNDAEELAYGDSI